MTWGRAVPILVLCVLFDLIRLFFEFFWLFGPALASVYCTTKVSDLVGMFSGLTAGACAAGATVLGTLGIEITLPFGTIMAMTVGLIGWGTVTLLLIILNPRIWKSSVWGWGWSILALGISEAPLLGSIPMLTITHIRLYAAQISADKAALKRYQGEQRQAALVAETVQQQRLAAQMQAQMQAAKEIPVEEAAAA